MTTISSVIVTNITQLETAIYLRGTTVTSANVARSIAVAATFADAPATAPAATHLSFSQQPVATGKGIAFTTMPKVQALLAGGGVDMSYTANVTLGITSSTGGTAGAGATLGGTVTVAAVAGVADFTSAGLSLNQGGTGFELHATSGTLTAADSSAFDVASLLHTFTGANSTTSTGNADTGQTPTAFYSAVYGISNNQAIYETPNSNSNALLVFDTGSANGVYDLTIASIATSSAYLAFRVVGQDDYWIAGYSSAGAEQKLWKVVGGGFASVDAVTVTGLASASFIQRVIVNSSNNITVKYSTDGGATFTTAITTTDSTHSAGTKIGMWSGFTGTLYDNLKGVSA